MDFWALLPCLSARYVDYRKAIFEPATLGRDPEQAEQNRCKNYTVQYRYAWYRITMAGWHGFRGELVEGWPVEETRISHVSTRDITLVVQYIKCYSKTATVDTESSV
jgi:hypothetical protein